MISKINCLSKYSFNVIPMSFSNCVKTASLVRSDSFFAAMAELVDALDSGSSRGNSVDVRVILAAIFEVGFKPDLLSPALLVAGMN